MFGVPTQTVAKKTLDSASASVTLTYTDANLTYTPRHLVVRVNANTHSEADTQTIALRFNSDSGSNYHSQRFRGIGSSAQALRSPSETSLPVGTYGEKENTFSGGDCLITDAFSTRSHKAVLAFAGSHEVALDGIAGRWANTAAITEVEILTLGDSFKAGSTFELCVVDESFNIDEEILVSDGTITVSSITGGNGDLVQIGNLRGAREQQSDGLLFDINADTTDANYARQSIRGDDSSVIANSGAYRSTGLNTIAADSADSGIFGAFIAQYTNYADGSNDRVWQVLGGTTVSGSLAQYNSMVGVTSMRRNNTAAITSIKIQGGTVANFKTGSMLSTYLIPNNSDLVGTPSVGSDTGRIDLTETATTVTFSSIPQTYDHLELNCYLRTDRPSSTAEATLVSLNSDTTTANYDAQQLRGSASSASADQSAASRFIGLAPATSATANQFGTVSATFYNYAKTDRHKHFLVVAGCVISEEQFLDLRSHRWENTDAITSITLVSSTGNDFITGCVFELRGISSDLPASAFIPSVVMF